MAFCTQCGANILADSEKFCNSCGGMIAQRRPVAGTLSNDIHTDQLRPAKRKWIIALLAVTALTVIGYLYRDSSESLDAGNRAEVRAVDPSQSVEGPTTDLTKTAKDFAHLEGIPLEQSTRAVFSLATQMGLGPDAATVVEQAYAAEQHSDKMKAIDGVNLIIDMEPYWNRVHELTGRAVKDIILAKSPDLLATQQELYRNGDSAGVNSILHAAGLSSELITFDNSWDKARQIGFSFSEWADIIDRYQRGDLDAILLALKGKLDGQ